MGIRIAIVDTLTPLSDNFPVTYRLTPEVTVTSDGNESATEVAEAYLTVKKVLNK